MQRGKNTFELVGTVLKAHALKLLSTNYRSDILYDQD